MLTCLPIITSQPVLSQNREQLFQSENLAQNRDAQDYLKLGKEFYNQGKLDEAITNYQIAIQLDPNYVDAYNNLGIALGRQEKLEEAIANFHKAIQLNPNFANAYSNLGVVLQQQGKLDEAVANFQKAIQLNPNFAGAYSNLGAVLRKQGKLEEAIATYQKAIQLNPNYADAYYNLGNALGKQGKLEEAIANFHKAIQLYPNVALAYNNLGYALQLQGKLEEAIANFHKAIQLNPNYADAYHHLGYALQLQGKLEEAIANFQKAIQLNPNYALAYISLGVALSRQGKLEEAIANFQKAIQLNPNHADAFVVLGLALQQQGKLEEAISNYEKAIQLNPNYAYAFVGLGLALQQQGKLAAAIQEYKRSLDIDPELVIAKNNLREAERLLAIKLNPPRPDIDDTKFLPSKADEPLVNVLRSTARIIAEVSAEGTSIGAGWVVKKEANTVWIVTNRHVISDNKTNILSKKIAVEFFSELPDAKRPRYLAKIIQSTDAEDHNLDLAVLKVTGIPHDIKELKMRVGRVQRDANVRIIGHPFTIEDPWSASRGQILNYNTNNPKFVIDAYVAQGNSGGPVIDKKNRVIGIMVDIRSSFDIAASSDKATPPVAANQPATGGVGLAYRIDIVLKKLREWGIID